MMTNADAAKAVIDSQAAKGLATYGVGLERSDLSVSALARYGAEEAADLLAYMVEVQRRAGALERENERLRKALLEHHRWHQDVGDILLPVEEGEPIKLDLSAEYADSSMCERTIAALGI